jgi:hypothetical protein
LEAALLNGTTSGWRHCGSMHIPVTQEPRYDSHDARTEDMPWEDSP